jgi:hypothetical protein
METRFLVQFKHFISLIMRKFSSFKFQKSSQNSVTGENTNCNSEQNLFFFPNPFYSGSFWNEPLNKNKPKNLNLIAFFVLRFGASMRVVDLLCDIKNNRAHTTHTCMRVSQPISKSLAGRSHTVRVWMRHVHWSVTVTPWETHWESQITRP